MPLFRHLKRSLPSRKVEPPLELPFKLHNNYPVMVADGLTKKVLSSKAKPRLISTVAQAMFHKKLFPTRQEYEHVAQLIIEEYPFLKSASGSGYVSCTSLLSKSITSFFL